MSAPTVSVVVGWRPGGLSAAADLLVARAAEVDDEAVVVRRRLGDAVDDAGGAWAATARSRAEVEGRRGDALADALREAARGLRAGADRLGAARDAVVAAVDRARSCGLEVGDDGRVLDPAPLLAAAPAEAPLERVAREVAPEQAAVRDRAERHRADHEAAVASALAAAAAADLALADSLTALDVPATLPSVLAAHHARTRLTGGDPVAALGTAGGVVVAGLAALRIRSTLARGLALRDYAGLAARGAPSPVVEEARRAFAHGTSGRPVGQALGRAFLPTTLVSGVVDATTGGGHEGGRAWATRGFGTLGAVGAGAVLAAPVLAPGVVVAGGVAVLAYGAWSTGGYVVDHWDQVEDAAAATDEWLDDQRDDAVDAVGDALDWARDRLASPATGLARLGGWS